MLKENKYSIRNLKQDFPTEEACLNFIFNATHNKKCSCGGHYSLIKGRKQYQCSKCRFQIAPTSGTVFNKSATPLILWFYAIFIFSNAKSGISAKELERQLGVTYKTAWRILSLIRKALSNQGDKLSGTVETDASMIGGKKKRNEEITQAYANKSTIMGAVERDGEVRLKIVENTGKVHTVDFVEENIEKGSIVMTDKHSSYISIAKGYDRHFVNHSMKEFVRGDVYINTVEAFFAHIKRSINGTYKVISKKHLQSYLDVFVFHRNNRHNDKQRFEVLLDTVINA